MKYRKKPIVIEAVRHLPRVNDKELRDFAPIQNHPQGACGSCDFTSEESIYVTTLEGDMTINPGDWVIKGIKGEFYPCKPDIFKATYEEVI